MTKFIDVDTLAQEIRRVDNAQPYGVAEYSEALYVLAKAYADQHKGNVA